MPKKIINDDALQLLIAEKMIAEKRRTGTYDLTYVEARNLVLSELDSVTPAQEDLDRGVLVSD